MKIMAKDPSMEKGMGGRLFMLLFSFGRLGYRERHDFGSRVTFKGMQEELLTSMGKRSVPRLLMSAIVGA